MISPHKTPALAKLAMLLLFAIATVAILDTTSISAQELGKTITSPFGVANPYMNASDASESGSEGDTFVDPETGEVGHIIRNPFGQTANSEMDNTDSDTFEEADEGDEFFISLPGENAVERNDSKREADEESIDNNPVRTSGGFSNSPKSIASSSNVDLKIESTDNECEARKFSLGINGECYCIKSFNDAAINYDHSVIIGKYSTIPLQLRKKIASNSYVEYKLRKDECLKWIVKQNNQVVASSEFFYQEKDATNSQIKLHIQQMADNLGKLYSVECQLYENAHGNEEGDYVKSVYTTIAVPNATIDSISFYHNDPNNSNKSIAFYETANLNTTFPVPEYQSNRSEQYPALYATGTNPSVVVRVRVTPKLPGRSIKIKGTNRGTYVLNLSQSTQNSYTTNSEGIVDCLMLAESITGKPRKIEQTIDWKTTEVLGFPFTIDLGSTTHSLYVIAGTPQPPWINTSGAPFGRKDLLDYLLVCHPSRFDIPRTFEGLQTESFENYTELITHMLFETDSYDKFHQVSEDSFTSYLYTSPNFETGINLTDFVNDLKTKPSLQKNTNSSDFAKALALLTRLIGIPNVSSKYLEQFKDTNEDHHFCLFDYSGSHNPVVYDGFLWLPHAVTGGSTSSYGDMSQAHESPINVFF